MILDQFGGLLGALFPLRGTGRPGRRRRRAFEAGRVVSFEASVLGAQPYCLPAVGVLHLSRAGLLAVPAAGAGTDGRPVPLHRLDVVLVRDRLRSDPSTIRPFWRVAECRDENALIMVGCAADPMELLLHALGRVRPAR
ncbi:hypothetical protein AB0D08_22770 [Kitasatospora sp. NPDC048540]|uniref:hypothetical protein n=1 Tax=unclassified Kitasatospora TaxID=2633591 RepID=UPI00053A2119|nr:hypothetical protein [Kitasatospora sp. MBT63]